ncbi:MAG TPA: thioredoxin-like domain-containing protein [Bacteroidales bacterium]|nr:thioredoxin-like domain-containing protein [Bacteroidales bacterium]HQG53526.1 thioredoxin-like domain-containing protein [Bacteroidales bacterium]
MKLYFKVSILGTLALLLYLRVNAQSGKVPPFRIIQPDGKIFKAEELPFGKPILIVYFSPECEECHKLTYELLNRINDLKNVSMVFITYTSVESVSKFVIDNNLRKYTNIYIGTEGNYLFVLKYYDIKQFPFIALFDKEGNLIKKYYSKEVNLDDLIDHLKGL